MEEELLVRQAQIFLKGVYLRLEMKSTQDGIETHRKRNPIYITFNCGRNEMKFCFEDGPKKRPIQQKPVILVLIK